MNRTNICKNIVQSVKDYIKDQVKLEPHRVEKHFVGGESFPFCKLSYVYMETVEETEDEGT